MNRIFFRPLLILCALMSLLAPLSADPLAVHLEGYTTNAGGITVYFNSNTAVADGQLSLTLGGKALPVKSLKKFGDTGEGVTYLLLADISGSISQKKLGQIKSIMKGLANSITAADNCSVCTVGNSATISPFVSGKDDIARQIDAVAATKQDTNLFAAIVKALDALATDAAVKTKKCLVVFSDGEDFFTKGYTRGEVEDKIKQAHLPVYTVAMLDSNPDSKLVEASKVLGSFARLSAGGIDTVFGLDKTAADDVAGRIDQSMRGGYVLTADISGASAVADQSYLEITLNAPGKGTAKDGYMTDATKIRALASAGAAKTAAPTPSPSPIPSPTPTRSAPAATPATGSSAGTAKALPIWALPAGTALLIAVLVLFIILGKKRKKGKRQLAEIQTAAQLEASLQTASALGDTPVCLHFTKVGKTEDECAEYALADEMIIGRDPSKSQLPFAEDELLSARHCKIRRAGETLLLSDLNSTNGTYLNGVPVKQETQLEQDDVILLGSMELRVSWKA